LRRKMRKNKGIERLTEPSEVKTALEHSVEPSETKNALIMQSKNKSGQVTLSAFILYVYCALFESRKKSQYTIFCYRSSFPR